MAKKDDSKWEYLPGGRVKDKETGAEGIIRTIGGRKVFIKDGQNLADAMIESGKFKGQKNKPGMRASYRKEKEKDLQEEKELGELPAPIGSGDDDKTYQYYLKLSKQNEKLYPKGTLNEMFEMLDRNEKIDKQRGKEPLREQYREEQFNQRRNEAIDKLNKNAEDGVRNDIKTYLSGEEDFDGSKEEFINELAKEWQVDKDKVEDLYQEQTEKYGSRNFKSDRPQNNNYKYDYKDGMLSVKDKNGEELASYGVSKENYDENPQYWKDRAKQELDEELYYLNKEIENDPYMQEAGRFNQYLNEEKGMSYDDISNMSTDDYEKQLSEWRKGKQANATPREKSNFERAKEEKEKLEQEMKDLENSWLTHYNESNFNDEEWRKKSDELMNARNEKREAFDKAFKDYINLADDKDLSWQDKVRRNDIAQEEELAKLKEKQNSPEYMFHRDKWEKDYYGTFEKYEKENAKIKEANAKPEDLYEPISSYYSFNKKRHELSGDKMNDDGSVAEWGDKKFTGKNYTNDEFMEHLEDANWHTERRMLETAGLTNQELSYIKDKVTLDSYGADLDRDKTQKLIDEAKAKFRGNKSTNDREFKASMGEVDIPDNFVAQFNDYVKKQSENKSTNDYKVKSGNPIESMANDRIKEKQNTLNNDKMILSEMKKRGMKTFGADGMTQEEIEARIKKNEDYIKTATSPQNTNFSMNDAIREKASKTTNYLKRLEGSMKLADKESAKANFGKYSELDNYEVYEQADKLANNTKDYDLKAKIHEQLDKIDKANKRGSGYAEGPTNELRKILNNQSTNEAIEHPHPSQSTSTDAVVHPHPSETTSIKVKGDSNVIPRNFTEGTIDFKREGENKKERYTIKKDEFGRYIGTDASGKEYQFPIGILRNHNVVEFVNSSDTPKTSSNDYMNSKIRKGAGVKDAYKEYLKNHKESNITFEQFKKIYK